MARKKEVRKAIPAPVEEVTVRQFIQENPDIIGGDSEVILRQLGGIDETFVVSEIPRKLLNRSLVVVQPKQGGREKGYSLYRMVYRKK